MGSKIFYCKKFFEFYVWFGPGYSISHYLHKKYIENYHKDGFIIKRNYYKTQRLRVSHVMWCAKGSMFKRFANLKIALSGWKLFLSN